MPDPFVHLHVASGFSLRHGASPPATLVERAVEHEMDTLALTDRDGTYGAVRFARACLAAGVAPVLGVDLAVAPSGAVPAPWSARDPTGASRRGSAARTPARGGAFRDHRLPRVTFLAAGRRGWAALCRLVSATHLAGQRGEPVSTLELVAEHAAGRDVLALLGPASEVGAAVTARRPDAARVVLDRWRDALGPTEVLVELVNHRVAGDGPTSASHAARSLRLAVDAGVTSVLTNTVRYADRVDAVTVDVLDAARRLVPLDARHVDRANAEGYLKSGKEMAEVAEEVCRLAGVGGGSGVRALLARTRTVAERCALDPRADLGLGQVHLPELGVTDPGARGRSADAVLRARCEEGTGRRYGSRPHARVARRLDDELAVIARLGFASYFLTVADVCATVRDLGIRSAARGSGAGSLVNYLLGVSGIDPLRHGLLMERFLSPLRRALPDIDLDVESHRRLEVYDAVLDRYGGERCVAVSMMDTYRVRHAVRDVGSALGMPGGEIDAIAKSFPHIRARDARAALRELPELRSSGLGEERLGLLFRLAERLDGLPRHVAMHPCGVLLSDATLLDRTPVEASFAGYPMSQFDKDDVEDLGLLKLDVLGIRMQSAMAHAVAEVRRVDGVEVDLDDEAQVPFDDAATYDLISSSRTLGCFQIESPGQRELVGKSGLDSFSDVIADISLFRPGPVTSDMITPYLEAKQGWRAPTYLHEDLRPLLRETRGVVVYHEQVIEIVALLAGCSLAEADEARRSLGDVDGRERTGRWFRSRAAGRGYAAPVVEAVWEVLRAFGAFGFCKAHAAAFALPTYQSAWLKTHHTAHFLAGVLTHDPGMYPKRLILDDARHFGVAVLGLDVDRSGPTYAVERLGTGTPAAYGIRLALAEVKGITDAEVVRIVAARPYASLSDFWQRAAVSRPVAERLVLAGAFDRVYGIGDGGGLAVRGRVTRRDLLLQVADLDRHTRATRRAGRTAARSSRASPALGWSSATPPRSTAQVRLDEAASRNSSDERDRRGARERGETRERGGVWAAARAQSRAARPVEAVSSVQLTLDLDDAPAEVLHGGEASGLPELDREERVRAELEILGLDASRHVLDASSALLDALGVTRSRGLLERRSRSVLLVAGVKVATQTPPIRSGRRVVFLTLDDATGPVDVTFFEDALGPFAATVFGSWQLLVRGELRRTGRRGVSVRATGCWDLAGAHAAWRDGGVTAVHRLMATPSAAEVAPAGESLASASRKLWHSSPGSPGR